MGLELGIMVSLAYGLTSKGGESSSQAGVQLPNASSYPRIEWFLARLPKDLSESEVEKRIQAKMLEFNLK